MMVVRVKGGTQAGWRSMRPKPGPWLCECLFTAFPLTLQVKRPGYLTQCPDCKATRPDGA